MNQEIKEKWIAALKSGKHKQGVGTLRRQNPEGESFFCCLGVLCDLYSKEKPEKGSWKETENPFQDPDTEQTEGFIYAFVSDEEDHTGILPIRVKNWAGLQNKDPILPDGETLSGMNDSLNNFDYIAEQIQLHL